MNSDKARTEKHTVIKNVTGEREIVEKRRNEKGNRLIHPGQETLDKVEKIYSTIYSAIVSCSSSVARKISVVYKENHVHIGVIGVCTTSNETMFASSSLLDKYSHRKYTVV